MTGQTKTVLICCNVYPPNFIGGAELIAHQQAKTLRELGIKVVVFAGDGATGQPRYSMREDSYDGLPVFRVSLEPRDYSSDFVNFSHSPVDQRFETLLDRYSPDVVHMHNIMGLSAGIIHRAKRRGIRTALTLHDHWGFCFKNTLIKRENEICNDYTRCAECMPLIQEDCQSNIPIRMRNDFLALQFSEVDVFISPSRYLAETYVRAGIPIGKMNVIWNGVDVDRFKLVRKERSDKVRFSFIGHFGAHKGIELLINALMRLPNRDRVLLNLVGTGEMHQRLREQVDTFGLFRTVKFWGKWDNERIEEVFEQTDVLILPSIWPENQPVSITEAMATRTPVIASDIGGIPELVVDGQTGYLFQPASVEQLATKMSEFVMHPENIGVLGEKGFERIKTNSLCHQVTKIAMLYG